MNCDLYFAPLQGYTEDAYRRIHNELCGGIKEYFTPFVRLENGGVRSKDIRDINPEHNKGVPVSPQIIARDADEMKSLMQTILPLGYQHIDINMGCPFPLQTRHGRGAGILPHPDKVKEICEIIKAETTKNSCLSFSIKMRLGLAQSDEWREILPILNDTPLKHITMHPRIAEQQYKGEVNIREFESFLSVAQHPVIYNGDIRTQEQIKDIATTYPISGIMIGRGLLARPTLAKEYEQGYEISIEERLTIARQMHDRLLAHYNSIIPNEDQVLGKIRTFWEYMEFELGRKSWKKIMKAGNMKNYLKELP